MTGGSVSRGRSASDLSFGGAHGSRVVRRIGWALWAALILAGCSQGDGGKSATPTTESIFKATSVRTGQIYVPPGRGETKGPIGANPSPAHGLPLNILSGLETDHPIYDGDFADPSALDVSNTLYFYASSSSPSKNDHGANIPVIGLSQGKGSQVNSLGTRCPRRRRGRSAATSGGPTCGPAPTRPT
jgi:hypothetical protein